ncbi:uncharacterized protein LOC131249698 [Magnolia sinica]|uniref:uncharacterized protein LOC131249698 n=1 Tax=Magnolia sinica TaxID=86752 RepID=UPI002658DD23|nr:uncharacterized protein LOC131249698 [Magnolia sinica]
MDGMEVTQFTCVQQVLDRGEKIELLVDKTENLRSQVVNLNIIEGLNLLKDSEILVLMPFTATQLTKDRQKKLVPWKQWATRRSLTLTKVMRWAPQSSMFREIFVSSVTRFGAAPSHGSVVMCWVTWAHFNLYVLYLLRPSFFIAHVMLSIER